MRELNYELKQLCLRNRDGSFATQYARERILTMIANQLHEMGFKDMRATSLKPKHVQALVERWKAEGLSAGTIKNRMTELRWWAEKIAKQNVIFKDNDHYGIAQRQYVTNVSKSRDLTDGDLAKITDPYTALSLKLQAAFGLRREESIKIRPLRADKEVTGWRSRRAGPRVDARGRSRSAMPSSGNCWTRPSNSPAGDSLIPKTMTYKQQLNRFKAQCMAAGIQHVHGHRHQYAQQRYQELTGWACPAQGGPTWKQLSREQKQIDREARLTISAELGHSRAQIVAVYCAATSAADELQSDCDRYCRSTAVRLHVCPSIHYTVIRCNSNT